MSHSQAAFTDKPLAFGSGLRLPQPVWLILFALAAGLAQGLSTPALIKAFAAGYGQALGSFALILIPSFILAACLSRQNLQGAPGMTSVLAPVTAAGMMCPDTSYAALSSIAQKRKLSVAFGSHAGYRLLFPAGPLIVATGLGVDSGGLLVQGLVLLIPVWLAGEAWSRYRGFQLSVSHEAPGDVSGSLAYALAPLMALAGLLLAGGTADLTAIPVLDFLTRPKGALIVAAGMALAAAPADQRRACLDAALSRSASLLLVIGAASAFGTMIIGMLPAQEMIPASASGMPLLLALFAASMIIKILHGSSTISLATAIAVLGPVVHATALPPAAAVLAICLGSLVILPTDSFYWLVRTDALRDAEERQALLTLVSGAMLQAGAGLLGLLAMVFLGLA